MIHAIYVLLAATLWSTIGVASVIGGDVAIMAFTRSIVAGIVGFMLYRRLAIQSVIAGLLLGILFSSYPLAAILAGVGTAAYLLYTAPLWATLASRILGEKPNLYDLIGVILIMVSVVFMGLDVGAGNITLPGYLAGLTAGVSYGLYIAVARYYSKKGMGSHVSLAAMPYTLIITTPLLLIHVVQGDLRGLDVNPVLAGVYMGIFTTLIPYVLFVKGVERVGASTASVLATAEPVLAAIWGFILFAQTPTPLTMIAYILITLALLITSIQFRRTWGALMG